MPLRVFILLTAFACGCVGMARLSPLRSADLLWQERMGELVMAGGHRIAADPFSLLLRGAPLTDHEWGFELLVAALVRKGGFRLVWAVNVVLVGALASASAVFAWRMIGKAWAVLLATAIVVTMASTRLELRPETFMLAGVMLAHAMRRQALFQSGPRRWFCVASPLLFAVAIAPFHGLSPLVALTSVLHATVALFERTWLTALADGLVAALALPLCDLVTPGTIRNILNSASGPSFMEHIVEWYSVTHYVARSGDSLPLVVAALAWISGFGLLLLRSRGRARLEDVLLVFAMSALATRFIRFTAAPAIAAMPWVIAGIAEFLLAGSRRMTRPWGTVVFTAAAAGMLWALSRNVELRGVGDFDWDRQPVAAVAWLREHEPDARLFNTFNFGAYLIYARYPDAGVLIDPRAWTLYPEAYARRYYEALRDPDAFERWVEEANLGVVLLPTSAKNSERLSTYLERSPKWNLAYRDPRAQVYLPR